MSSCDPFPDRVRLLADRIAESSAGVAESGAPAIAGLYDLTAQRLLRYAATITRNQHDAEDAVHSTLVRVAGQPPLLAESQRPWAYLLRMVRNDALLILRRKKRWSLVENLADLVTRRTVDGLEQEEAHRAVWAALRQLPRKQSEVVVLKIWEEMTFAEIGEILDISTSTAASRYRYAIEKLTVKLDRDMNREVRHESGQPF